MSYQTAEIDEQAVQETARKLLPRVMDWLKSGDPDYNHNEAEILADLTKALDTHDLDGYKLARELDDWSPDAELVEILDDAHHLMSLIEKRLVQEHLVRENIQPKFVVGTKVKVPGRFFARSWNQSKNFDSHRLYEGTIRKIEADGKYMINSQEAGHLDPDNTGSKSGVTGVYINWKDVESSNPDLLLQPSQNSDIV